jgi:transcriptional regulator with XRE-family HTH domain
MQIGERLRCLREHKNLTQEEVAQRAGLVQRYISRVENGHAVPKLETLEKWARAMQVPLYVLFYEEKPPRVNERLAMHVPIGLRVEKGRAISQNSAMFYGA